MTHITEIIVRPYECDSYCHVNNAVYLNYLEHCRMDFLHAIGFDYKAVVAAGIFMYVTEVNIKYKGSAVLDDKLFVETTHTKLGKISGEFTQIIKREDGLLCVDATVKWACVDSVTKRPTKLPEQFRVKGLDPDA